MSLDIVADGRFVDIAAADFDASYRDNRRPDICAA